MAGVQIPTSDLVLKIMRLVDFLKCIHCDQKDHFWDSGYANFPPPNHL